MPGTTCPHLVRNNSGQVTWLTPNGAAIGIIEDYEITARQVQLEAGDALVACKVTG